MAASTCCTNAGSAVVKSAKFLHELTLEGRLGESLTTGARRGMDAGQKCLGGGDGTLETLHDLGECVADLGLLFEPVLEVLEYGGVEKIGP